MRLLRRAHGVQVVALFPSHGQRTGLVIDIGADSAQGDAADPVVVTAQQQIRWMRAPAARRDNPGITTVTTGLAGQQQARSARKSRLAGPGSSSLSGTGSAPSWCAN